MVLARWFTQMEVVGTWSDVCTMAIYIGVSIYNFFLNCLYDTSVASGATIFTRHKLYTGSWVRLVVSM